MFVPTTTTMISRATRLLSSITIFLVGGVESFAFGEFRGIGGGGGGGGCDRGGIVRADAILRRGAGSTTTATPVIVGTSPAPRSSAATASQLRSSPSDDDDDDDAEYDGGDNARVIVGGGGGVVADVDDFLSRASSELGELSSCLSLALGYLSRSDGSVSAEDVILACDAVDDASSSSPPSTTTTTTTTTTIASRPSLRRRVHEFGRYRLLSSMMRSDYGAYVATAEFLSPGRVPRSELPNVQDVGRRDGDVPPESSPPSSSPSPSSAATGETPLVPDCELKDATYDDSPLDGALLRVFRKFVAEYTGLGAKGEIPGIGGLLAQGREYMTMELPPGTSYADHADAQHDMVKSTLGRLMTPALPPFYRVFMSGIVPKLGTEWDGRQLGPWSYAPYLTSIVTPVFFGFLVGPSRPNRRKDGMRGGLVVEKCKFLQESKCKGLCLHQCKIPAQEFFAETLGLDLTVRPNFVTQECQWSFGEKPLPVGEDPTFPRGCLAGCESRAAMAGRKVAGGDALCM